MRRYVGPDYGWMWPFPATIRRWFGEVIAGLEKNQAPRRAFDPPPGDSAVLTTSGTC